MADSADLETDLLGHDWDNDIERDDGTIKAGWVAAPDHEPASREADPARGGGAVHG